MYKRDPPYNNNSPTFSSSLLNEIFLSIDREPPHPLAASADGCKLRCLLDEDRKMSTLRRAQLVHKWMEKPNYDNSPFAHVVPPPPPRQKPSPPPAVVPAVPATADEDPDSFFSTTSVSSSDSSFGGLSSTASEAETPSFDSSSKPKTSCFGPLRAPKPVKTKAKVANAEQFEEDCSTNKSSSSSRAVKIYSQLKSLKQPISPGIKLAKYINSLFIKEAPTSRKKKITKNTPAKESDSFEVSSRKFRGIPVPDRKYKSEQASPEWSISASSLTRPPYLTCKHDSQVVVPKKGNENSVSASATSIAADHMLGSKPALIKRYEELRRLKIGEIEEEDQVDMNRKVLEEVALDLLNSYCKNTKIDRNGGGGGDDDDNDKDDSSCSSSDLFEIDHLSLIGNEELPVYETTRINL